MNPPKDAKNPDPDYGKGAVESSRPEDNADGNVASFNEQLDHRFQNSLNKSSDSGMSENGQTEEFSMEEHGENELNRDEASARLPLDAESNADAETPGATQRKKQNDKKDDPQAA
jgi:hypothetical protein